MALIPITERVPPNTEIHEVYGYSGHPRKLAYPVNEIAGHIRRAAHKHGFAGTQLFSVFSGYRSEHTQKRLFERRIAELVSQDPSLSRSDAERQARRTVAPPGRSSHHTGYAFDIYLGHKPGYNIASSNTQNVRHIEGTPAYAFMRKIAQEYGLTQLPNEPWHWECDTACRSQYVNSQQKGSAPTPTTQPNTTARIALSASILGVAALSAWVIVQKARA